jgi:hypothetical protein
MGPRGFSEVKASRFRDIGTWKVVGCQPYAPAVFPPRSILVLIFKRLSQPLAHGIVGCHGKTPQWHQRGSIPGPSDCPNHYATPGPLNVGTHQIYSAFGKSLCAYKRCWKWYPRTIVSKNWIKQLHTLPVLHFNRCLTTEYSETTTHFNGNFDIDNQIYVP